MLKLEASILAQKIGGSLVGTATRIVMGDGNLDAKIMFVGEAPGKKEDETGIPFVGASGKLLNLLLESIALDRNSVYITNIVKYRPPNNRDPSKTEKREFLPFLQQQIEIINPKVICPLGRHPASVLLPTKVEISKIHGSCITVEKRKIVPLYHPAAAMYDPRLRSTLFDDFQRLKQYLAEIDI